MMLEAIGLAAYRINRANPSWGRRRSGGRGERIVGALGNLSQRGEWGAVYQGWGLGVVGACFALLTTSRCTLLCVECVGI